MKRFLLIVLLFISHSTFSQDLSLGLRAYYPFNGNANDASGNNNNPIFNNATLTSDIQGNPNSAYHFNGANNYMQIPNSPSLNMGNQLSIALKVRPTGFYLGPCHGNSLLMKGDNDFLPGNYLMRFDDNAYTFGGNCASITVDQAHQNFYGTAATAPPPGYTPYIQVNQWYSIVVTNDGTTSNLYVNCELKASMPQTLFNFTNNYDLFFGKLNNPQYPYWLNGDLDEVRIYDRALTQDEVNLYGSCSFITNCNNWLKTQVAGQSVKIGDLDISGDQITVEAQINRTAPYVGTYIYAGDVVSKHTDPSSVNYLLRPNDAEITTTTGYHVTPPVCDISLDKTYHIALVYNGSTLKFYRNGFLMSQVAATGNLLLNDDITTIGDWANYVTGVGTNFQGTINEVRIWNIARTQGELRAYMNTSLSNPSSQTGLLAYYTFDNLINKQGNTTWNGTLMGAASINNTNPNCVFVADSCLGVIPCSLSLTTNITDVSVCPGTSVQLIATSAATNYSWAPAAGLTDSTIYNPVANVNSDATYIVTATSGSCEKKDTVNIHVYPLPFANAGSDMDIITGDQVMLNGSGTNTGSILWTPANTLTGANSFTPIATPTTTTTYTLIVTDINNCIATDETIVYVKDRVCANPPNPINAFTPNGDGINDKWLAYTDNSCYKEVSVSVYNRYGSLVYRNYNYQNDWEGTYKGKTLPDGTYYYVNTYKRYDGRTIVLKGDVTILR